MTTRGISRRTRALIAGLAAVALPLAWMPAAHATAPAAPTGLSPNGSSATYTPPLSWTRVSNATSYQVQVDTSSSFASPDFGTITTTNSRWVPTKPLSGGTTYWRVRAANAASEFSAWRVAKITTGGVAAPAPQEPADNATLIQPSEPPILRWAAVPNAASYTVEIDHGTPDFINPDVTAINLKTPYYLVSKPQDPNQDYYWHVKAVLANGQNTEWSGTRTYHLAHIGFPERVYPNDGADNTVTDAVMDWKPVPGARTYELEISTDQNFPDSDVTGSFKGLTSTRYTQTTSYPNNQYYWRVRAYDANNHATPWETLDVPWSFNRVWRDKPQLLAPDNTLNPTHGDPFSFQWTPVSHASNYTLEMGTDPNFSPTTYRTCTTEQTTYTPGYSSDSCMPAQGVVYYWRVQAHDDPQGIDGVYSDVHQFVYSSGVVTQLTPTNGQTVAVPTLTWASARDAVSYKVTLKDNTGHSVSAPSTTYATSWTPENLLTADKSPYTWQVQSRDLDNQLSPLGPAHSFSIGGSLPTTSAIALTPLTGISTDAPTTRFPKLTWEPMSGAAYYKIYAGVHLSNFYYQTTFSDILGNDYHYPSATNVDDKFPTPGEYDWQVEAYDSNNVSLGFGSVGTFKIVDLEKVSGQTVSIGGVALDQGHGCTLPVDTGQPGVTQKCADVPTTPTLSWDPVPDAGYYMVYLFQDRDLTNAAHGGVFLTQNTRWTPKAGMTASSLPDSQAGQAYYWYVRPCVSAGHCAPDPSAQTNAATNAFSKTSPPVQLTSPTQTGTLDNPGTVITHGEVTFKWQDYVTTSTNTTWAPTGETGTQAARQYRIQVNTTPVFTGTLLETATVDQNEYTSPSKTYPEGVLYWRVQILDAQGNLVGTSATQSFKKTSYKPQLLGPVNGAKVAGAEPFRWSMSSADLALANTQNTGDGTWTLEVYKNNDTLFSTANRVISATQLTQQAYVPVTPLPASPSAYVWRVARVDVGKTQGPWSATGKFYSSGATPTLATPSSGTYIVPNSAFFGWSAVAGATSYAFQSHSVGSTSIATVNTFATAHAPTATLRDGSYEWRVQALDITGAPIGTSAWRAYTVDGTAPTVTSLTPTSPYRTSNFVIKFSEPVRNASTTTIKINPVGGSTMKATVTMSTDRKTATLDPANNLVSGKSYVIHLLSGITDDHGNHLVAKNVTVRVR